MFQLACVMAAVFSICAAGMQVPPLSRIATFDGALLHIKGDPGAPVILQGSTDAHDVGKFSWDRLKEQLFEMERMDEAERETVYQTLAADILRDDVAASMLLNMHYAQKHRYHYVLFSYRNTGGAEVSGACTHHGQSQPSHWCKAQALESALELKQESEYFMWLDADVIVRNMDIDVYQYLNSGHRCFDGQIFSSVGVFAWFNFHFGDGECKLNGGAKANSGALVFNKNEKFGMKYFLNEWWLRQNATGIPGSDTHDQGAFNEALKQSPDWAKVIFGDNNFADVPSQFLVHRCGACHWMPEQTALVKMVMAENSLTVDVLRGDVSQIAGSVANA